MITLDTTNLEFMGRSDDTSYYRIEGKIFGAVPDSGARDNAQTSAANVRFLNKHFKEHGPGVLLVFMDQLASQDRAGRRTYQTQLDPDVLLGVALVGGSALGRAVGSVFLGLGGTTVPFKLFPSYVAALDWARTVLKGGGL